MNDKIRAADLACLQKDKSACSFLATLLQDPDYMVRFAASNALCEIGASQEQASQIISALDDENSFVRSNAAECLIFIKSVDAVPSLLEHLNDPDTEVQIMCMMALKAVALDYTLPYLLPMLNSSCEFVRMGAIAALEPWCKQTLVRTSVQSLQNDSDELVRTMATDFLNLIP